MSILHKILVGTLFLVSVGCSKKSSGTIPQPPFPPADTSFQNPLLTSGPDPWVIQRDSNYYYTPTLGNRIAIYTTSKMSELNKASVTPVWSPPASGAYSRNIWAPELHYLQGKWYMYFAADDGNNSNHRMYVLENTSSNPLTGSWEFKGKIADPLDKWAIDGSVFEHDGKMYFIWSGWEGDVDIRQDIYIAKMKDPFTIEGNRVMISTPSFGWEKMGLPAVNEGPEAIRNSSGRLFITFSASGCWTDDYALGLLSLKSGGDPLIRPTGQKKQCRSSAKRPRAELLVPVITGFSSRATARKTG